MLEILFEPGGTHFAGRARACSHDLVNLRKPLRHPHPGVSKSPLLRRKVRASKGMRPPGEQERIGSHGRTARLLISPPLGRMRLVKAMRAHAAPIVRLATRSCPVEGMSNPDLKRQLRSRRIRPIVPLAKISGYRFTKFGPGGKSPHQEIAALYLATGSRDEVRRYLVAHLEGFRPKSLAETLFNSNGPDLDPLNDLSPLTKLHPWDPVIQISTGYLGQGAGTFGPVSMEKVEKECDRFTRSIDSIVRHGYRPEAYSRGFISGYMVFLGDDYRFVVRNGLHRLGALAALGVTELAVCLTKHRPSVVDASEVDNWAQVRSGFCSRDLALRLTRRYFE